MTDSEQHALVQPGDVGSRKPPRRARRLWIAVLLLILVCATEFPFVTWDSTGGYAIPPLAPNVAGVWFVGEVTMTRHYGIFRVGIFNAGAQRVMVTRYTLIYDDHRFFCVASPPDYFFRSLIDKSKFPHIAVEPFDRHPLSATTATGAVEETKRFMKSQPDAFLLN